MALRRKARKASSKRSVSGESMLDIGRNVEEEEIIERLNRNDVVLDDGAGANSCQLGNHNFQQVLQEYTQEYKDAKEDEKLMVAIKVMDVFQERFPRGRFVKKLSDGATHVKLLQKSILPKIMKELERTEPSTNRRSTRKRKSAKKFQEEEWVKSTVASAAKTIPANNDTSDSEDEDESMAGAETSDEEEDGEEEEDPDFFYTLHENDVLAPRNSRGDHVAESHLGNIQFQEMLVEYQESYHHACSEGSRMQVVRDLIVAFQTQYPPGRFVKRLKDGSYQKIQEPSVLQKVDRALERAMDEAPTCRKKLSRRPKKRPAPASVEVETTRSGRKRRAVIRLQDEQEAATTPVEKPTKPAKRTTPRSLSKRTPTPSKRTTPRSAAKKVAPPATPATKRTSPRASPAAKRSSPRTPSQPKVMRRTSPRTVPKRVSPETVPRRTSPRTVPKQVSTETVPRRTSPRLVPKRAESPETVPRRSGRTSPSTASNCVSPEPMETSSFAPMEQQMMNEEEMPVFIGAKSKPHLLGQLAQKFTKWVMTSQNADEIDLEQAALHLEVPKRRIYDVVLILEGAGLLKRNHKSKNSYRWATPLIRTPEELEAAYEKEEKRLDTWIEALEKLNVQSSISGQQLAPLVNEDTTLLAVHVPKDTIIRTIHMPSQEEEEAFAFKLTTPAPKSRKKLKAIPKAWLVNNDDAKLTPIDLAPPTSSPEPMYVPHRPSPSYARPPVDYQGTNPMDMLLRALPKPPPTAGSYSSESKQQETLQVSDDDEERTLQSFQTLLQASALCQ